MLYKILTGFILGVSRCPLYVFRYFKGLRKIMKVKIIRLGYTGYTYVPIQIYAIQNSLEIIRLGYMFPDTILCNIKLT